MGWTSIPTWRGGRRGASRAALLLVLGLIAILAASCGKSGRGAETDPEKGSDALLLNAALARERTLRDAYTHAQQRLPGSLRPLVRRLRAHQHEYVDALTKAIRGVGGQTEDAAVDDERLELPRSAGRSALLTRLHELESAALAAYVEAAPRLYTAAPRTLAASLAAGHAQHLVVLRQPLGARLAQAAPEAFDGGVVPPPGGTAAGD